MSGGHLVSGKGDIERHLKDSYLLGRRDIKRVFLGRGCTDRFVPLRRILAC